MGEFSDLSPVPVPETLKTPPSRTLPFREDCWSEEATATLVESWGRRYVELNRGNLRQKDWQEVADAVNALHGHSKKTRRTDVQCKNRIDTLKKKYKVEKAKFVDSNGTLPSSWPFYARLDALVGPSVKNQAGARGSPQVSNSFSPSPLSMQSPPMGIPLYNKRSPLLSLPPPPLPVEPMVLPQKRQFSATDSSYFKKNYSTIAAEAFSASAAPRDGMDVDDDEEEDEDEDDVASDEDEENEVEEREVGTVQEEGMRSLAKAIERFGEIYERVENMKQKQMVELEKQRMQFAKDLEVQRMQLFMDTQVQLEKIKHSKRSGSDDIYS